MQKISPATMEDYKKIFTAITLPCLLLECREGSLIIKDTSSCFSDLTGITSSDLVGQEFQVAFPENPGQANLGNGALLGSIKEAMKRGKPVTLPFIRYDLYNSETLDFTEKYWQMEIVPVKTDRNAKVKYVLLYAIEKTLQEREELRRRELEEELDRKREQQKIFIDKNPDGLYSLDKEGRFLHVNEGLSRLTEVPEENLRGMSFLPFCSPEDMDRIKYHFNKGIRGENQEFEARFFSAKGRELIIHISLSPMVIDRQVQGVFGIAKDVTDKVKAQSTVVKQEFELESSRKKFKALVEDASDLIGILDMDGNCNYISESVKSILGTSPEDYLGKNAFDLIHPQDRSAVEASFSELQHKRQVCISPFRFKAGDGEWRWLETTATNLSDDPNVQGVVTNSREVTDLIKKNQEIRELYERYSLAAAATEDLIYDWDLEADKVERFFKGNKNLFGYSPEKLGRRGFWKEHVHPDEVADLGNTLRDTLQDPMKNQIKTEYRFRRANGTYAHIIDRGQIVRDENGKAIRLIGATSDISGIVNRREALKIANKRFSYAMKATREMIWDWDIVKDAIHRSRSFKKVYGYDPSHQPSVENFWFMKIAGKDRHRVETSLKKALEDPAISKWRQEYRFVKKNGDYAYVVDRGYILRDMDGKAIRMVGAALDVTESRKMLREIKKQNKILKEVAWEQSHVVRAPLARLKGLLDLLDSDCYEVWTREELIDLIRESADELDEVIVKIIRKTEEIEVK
ncbi:PAS domain-containing protein [Salinimicrobium flavum]|uniref:histidine kinase n=1 Tax=Salinimicrobium flavum TaxID=1737065 RepID=A0ABW5IXH9_9FLAO